MIRQVKHRVFIGRGRIIDPQGASLQRVTDNCRQRPRKSLLSVLTDIRKFDSILYFARRPHRFVKSAGAAMQRIISVVLGNGISLAVKLKASMRDPVRVAADDRSKISGIAAIAVEGVIPQYHIVELSVPVRGA